MAGMTASRILHRAGQRGTTVLPHELQEEEGRWSGMDRVAVFLIRASMSLVCIAAGGLRLVHRGDGAEGLRADGEGKGGGV